MDQLKIAELAKYAELDMSEVGEMLSLLINIHNHKDCLGDRFSQALETEMQQQLDWFQNNTKIIKRNVSETHTITELEYIT